MRKLLIWPLAFALVSCVEPVELSGDESDLTSILSRAKVEFLPSASIVPFPNNLLLTGGTPEAPLVNIPARCNESPTQTLLRESIINTLDGFGAYQYPIQFTLTEAVDPATVAENVTLLDLGVSPPAVIPTVAIAGESTRSLPGCVGTEVASNVTLVPQVALSAGTNHMVLIKSGLKAASGAEFGADWTWALIRGKLQPVEFGYVDNVAPNAEAGEWGPDGTQTKVITSNRTPLESNEENFETLEGLLLLWEAHKDILDVAEALGTVRDDVVLAWSFKTLSTTTGLDLNVAGSAAQQALDSVGGVQITDYFGPGEAGPYMAAHMNHYFGFNVFEEGKDHARNWAGSESRKPTYYCDDTGGDLSGFAMACSNVGAVMYGEFSSPQFQLPFDDRGVITADGTPFVGAPGPWMDQNMPAQASNYEDIRIVITQPATEMPADGYPVVFFGHGVGLSKEQSFPVATELAAKGIATVSMDWVAQGERAVKTAVQSADCDTDPMKRPAGSPEDGCYYKLLATNPLVARDNARQSALDYMFFMRAMVGSCGSSGGCAGFKINNDQIGYLGISIGGLIGQMTVAMSPELDIKALGLSNTGVGWIEIVEKTNPFYNCPLVNSGIESGTLVGELWSGEDDLDALCLNNDPADPNSFLNQPGWAVLASAYRWTVDVAEPANYVSLTAARGLPTLIQMADNDHTMPNDASQAAGNAYRAGWQAAGETVSDFISSIPGADGYTPEIDTQDKLLLKYVDVEGEREYEHDTLNMPTPRLYCLHEATSTPCSQSELERFADWVAGTRHYQADMARFFEKHLTAGGN
ncbi:MAG: hypothetical protein VX210_03435 [Myxococcota bacterium]|nr:hypothetical protein [Myxococcota bacterium]